MTDTGRKGKPPTRKQLLAAIDAIERIVSDDFCEDLSMREGLTGDLATADKKISAIYRIAHSWSPSHSCYHVHTDWRKEVKP